MDKNLSMQIHESRPQGPTCHFGSQGMATPEIMPLGQTSHR
jgi:hypothetical protein